MAVKVLSNDGHGQFPETRTTSVPFASTSIEAAAGDLNGDCLPDIVLGALPSGFVLLADGAGGYTLSAGETWNFQCWFRDLNPMLTSNLSDAVSVTFSGDPRPLASFAPSCAVIEEDATTVTTFVELSWTPTADVELPYTVSGDAAHGTDWTVLNPSPLVIPAGTTSVAVVIAVGEDGQSEPAEVGRIELSQSSEARLGVSAVFELSIRDDD
ncbi:MAG: VCBS repeat-containing protein [bacterium]|nr:VCBS repeat-containing protein [bacterium]